jgi:hypothetical protein
MKKKFTALLPCIHTYRVNVRLLEEAARQLRQTIEAEEVTYFQTDHTHVSFFGDMDALREIHCPRCGAPIEIAWWRGEMEHMEREDHYFVLERTLPCCGKAVSFNDLRYDPPCGFASLAFLLRAPVGDLNGATRMLSDRFGLPFRAVDTMVEVPEEPALK